MAVELEWDDAKAAVSRQRHGIAFSEAVKAFGDPFAVECIEHRWDYGKSVAERMSKTTTIARIRMLR